MSFDACHIQSVYWSSYFQQYPTIASEAALSCTAKTRQLGLTWETAP